MYSDTHGTEETLTERFTGDSYKTADQNLEILAILGKPEVVHFVEV